MKSVLWLLFLSVAFATAGAEDLTFESARWLWPHELGAVVNTTVEFRQAFVAAQAGVAHFAIAADTVYAVELNGRFVHSGRFPDVPPQRYYDEWELEGVRAGTNELKVSLYVQGFDSYQTLPGDPGVMFSLRGPGVRCESGQETDWRLSLQDRSEGVPLVTPQLGFSFEFDAAAPAAKWKRIAAGDAVRGPRDFVLTHRPVPRVEILPTLPTKMQAQGRLDGSPLPADVAKGMDDTRMTPVDSSAFFEANGKSVRPEFFKDGFYFLVDLGREEAGFLSLDIDTDAGVVIDVGHAEHSENGRICAFLGGRNFAGRYRARDGRQTYFRWARRMAGRYLQLHVRGARTHFALYHASVRPAVFPVKERPCPKGLSEIQRAIWDTAVRTLRLCMHEHYEDCPWREQALYANDARNQMLCGYFAFDDENRMPELALAVHARGLREDGWLEMCMPARINITIPSFTLCWILSVADNLAFRKDATFTRRMMPTVRKILDRRVAEMHDGLLPCPAGRQYWHFYEWACELDGDLSGRNAVRPGEFRYESPLNLFFILALEAGARCAEATGDQVVAERWRDVARQVCLEVRRRFWNEKVGQVETSFVRQMRPGELVQTLALLADAVPPESRARVVNKLMRPSDWSGITLSQTLYKYEALIASGGEAAAAAFRSMEADWSRMVEAGATSFWEMREGWQAFGNAGSLCHGWSAIPVYIYGAYPNLRSH